MVYKIPLRTLPKIEEAYEIERKTVWRCADKRSILLFITLLIHFANVSDSISNVIFFIILLFNVIILFCFYVYKYLF